MFRHRRCPEGLNISATSGEFIFKWDEFVWEAFKLFFHFHTDVFEFHVGEAFPGSGWNVSRSLFGAGSETTSDSKILFKQKKISSSHPPLLSSHVLLCHLKQLLMISAGSRRGFSGTAKPNAARLLKSPRPKQTPNPAAAAAGPQRSAAAGKKQKRRGGKGQIYTRIWGFIIITTQHWKNSLNLLHHVWIFHFYLNKQ